MLQCFPSMLPGLKGVFQVPAMRQHDLYFLKREDARKAFIFIRDEVTPFVTLSDEKLTFFTCCWVNFIEQVIILQHVNVDRPVFNM
jgi:hypothetical protein